jgi:hypothetical protein
MIQKSIMNDLAIHCYFSCSHLPFLSENASGTLHIHFVERTNKRRKGLTVQWGSPSIQIILQSIPVDSDLWIGLRQCPEILLESKPSWTIPSLSENALGSLHIHSVKRSNKRRKGLTVRMGLTKRPNNSPIHPCGLRSMDWTRTVSRDIIGIKTILSN